MSNTPDDPVDEYNKILSSEGMPEELPEIRPKLSIDREWYNHFDCVQAAYADARQRVRLDSETTTGLQGLLADIRWGRHDAGPLTPLEREVFDPYCDGLTEQEVAVSLGVSQATVSIRLRRILKRYSLTTIRLAKSRGRPVST
jgi:DNA-binding NarL/FixJ family response regulator